MNKYERGPTPERQDREERFRVRAAISELLELLNKTSPSFPNRDRLMSKVRDLNKLIPVSPKERLDWIENRAAKTGAADFTEK